MNFVYTIDLFPKKRWRKAKNGKWIRVYSFREILEMRLGDIMAEEIRREIDKELIEQIRNSLSDFFVEKFTSVQPMPNIDFSKLADDAPLWKSFIGRNIDLSKTAI